MGEMLKKAFEAQMSSFLNAKPLTMRESHLMSRRTFWNERIAFPRAM